MVSHHSVTAASTPHRDIPEWIVHTRSDPPRNLQITSNCQSEKCATAPAFCGMLNPSYGSIVLMIHTLTVCIILDFRCLDCSQ